MDNHKACDPMLKENPKSYDDIKGTLGRNERRLRSWETWKNTYKNISFREEEVWTRSWDISSSSFHWRSAELTRVTELASVDWKIAWSRVLHLGLHFMFICVRKVNCKNLCLCISFSHHEIKIFMLSNMNFNEK